MAPGQVTHRRRSNWLLAWFILALALTTATLWALHGLWIALIVTMVVLVTCGDLVLAAWVNRRVPMLSGPEAIIGRMGTVIDSHLTKDGPWHGRVRVDGEIWNAYANRHDFAPGEPARVVAVEGLRLRVACKEV